MQARQPRPACAYTSTIRLPDDPTLRSLPERFSALFPASSRATATDFTEGEELITPQLYASCYGMCRQAIHNLPDHEEDRVLIGAVAPWNNQTVYPGNPGGDWIKYFQDILLQCGANGCDGITLHTYTHGTNPTLILDNSKLPGFPQYHCHFQAYRDFMQAIPVNMRNLPVFITETDQGSPWENANRGWVQAAYAEIDRLESPELAADPGIGIVPLAAGWTAGISRAKRVSLKISATPCGTITSGRSKLNSPKLCPGPFPNLKGQPQPAAPEMQDADFTESIKPGRGMVYRVQWLKGRPPSPLHAGQRVNFPVTVRNTGTIAWPATGSQHVALSYHFSQNRGEAAVP